MNESKTVDIVQQHNLMHNMYPYTPFVDVETGSVTRFEDASRYKYNLVDADTDHAALCLQHWLSDKALWGSMETQTELKSDNKSGVRCNCALALKMTKSEQGDAMYGVAPHVQDLRKRRLALFVVSYKNYLRAQKLGLA